MKIVYLEDIREIVEYRWSCPCCGETERAGEYDFPDDFDSRKCKSCGQVYSFSHYEDEYED